MKKRAPGTYGFTTTKHDKFVARVAKEAKPQDRFLVSLAKDTFAGDMALTVLVHKDAIPLAKAGLTLLGLPFKKHWGSSVPRTPFKFLTVAGDKKVLNIAKAQIQRAKNYLAGRTVRVLVESL